MGMDILLLEDDGHWTHIVKLKYSKSHRITDFRHVPEALEAIKRNNKDFGLVIADYRIGKINGDALFYSTQELYASEMSHRDMPFFVMYTAHPDIAEEFSDPEYEGIAAVVKPDSQELLAKAIAKVNQAVKDVDDLTAKNKLYQKVFRYGINRAPMWRQVLEQMAACRQMYDKYIEDNIERKINHWKALRCLDRWMRLKNKFPDYAKRDETFKELAAWYESIG